MDSAGDGNTIDQKTTFDNHCRSSTCVNFDSSGASILDTLNIAKDNNRVTQHSQQDNSCSGESSCRNDNTLAIIVDGSS